MNGIVPPSSISASVLATYLNDRFNSCDMMFAKLFIEKNDMIMYFATKI